MPLAGDGVFSVIGTFGARFAKRKRVAIFSVAGIALLLRIGLLWFAPVPVPEAHDAFSYLLAADTFVHG
jgi:hypothetical protein